MLKAGSKCWVSTIGKNLFESTVVSAGSKYITTTPQFGGREIKFHTDSHMQVTEYSPRYKLYETKEEYEQEINRNSLIIMLEDKFRNPNIRSYSTDKIIRILKAIEDD